MTTLICQVQSRLPVAVVALFGTLDSNSAVRMMIALRDVIADAPIALIVDAAHLVVTSDRALSVLGEFARQSRLWPGTTVSVAGASAEVAARIHGLALTDGDETATDGTEPHGGIALYDSLGNAMGVATALPVPQRRSLALSPDRNAPARSRQFVQDVCADWGIGRVASLAELVASELVTNAVTHARTPMNMTLRLIDSRLSVDVRDADPRPMFRPTPGAGGAPNDEHGRGLLVLDAMADAWGTSPTGDGKVVWANIRLK
jgi:hypothetical protein